MNSDNTEMDNFHFDEHDDVQVEDQVLSEDVTANKTTTLNEKDVQPISKMTEEKDNKPFIVLYINLIRSRRVATSLDYEDFGYDDDLYYGDIDDYMFGSSFSNPFLQGLPQNDLHTPFITPREMHHHDDFEFTDF